MMEQLIYQIKKVSRGQYQVVDQWGKDYFALPASLHECNLFVQGEKAVAKIIRHKRVRAVVLKHLDNVPELMDSDVDDFIYQHVYKMHHKDIIAFMKRPALFLAHIKATANRNKASRQASLINKNMETETVNGITYQVENDCVRIPGYVDMLLRRQLKKYLLVKYQNINY